MNKLKDKVSTLSTDVLKTCAKALFYSKEDGSIIALIDVMAELEKRMPEADFCAFCDSIQ